MYWIEIAVLSIFFWVLLMLALAGNSYGNIEKTMQQPIRYISIPVERLYEQERAKP